MRSVAGSYGKRLPAPVTGGGYAATLPGSPRMTDTAGSAVRRPLAGSPTWSSSFARRVRSSESRTQRISLSARTSPNTAAPATTSAIQRLAPLRAAKERTMLPKRARILPTPPQLLPGQERVVELQGGRLRYFLASQAQSPPGAAARRENRSDRQVGFRIALPRRIHRPAGATLGPLSRGSRHCPCLSVAARLLSL